MHQKDFVCIFVRDQHGDKAFIKYVIRKSHYYNELLGGG
jgi:hypothetical protein